MRVILDTNALVSGIFWSGPPNEILRAWRSQTLELVLSSDILDEYKRVAIELSAQFPAVDLSGFMSLLTVQASIHSAPVLPHPVCEDPDDDKFISCALANDVFHIVSGDKALLKVSGYQKLEILKPKDFVTRYLGHR